MDAVDSAAVALNYFMAHQMLMTVLDLLARGEIQPVIAARLPLADAARAHELLGRAAVSGKIVLTCADEQRDPLRRAERRAPRTQESPRWRTTRPSSVASSRT